MTSIIRYFFEIFIPNEREERIRKWASDNAYSLVFVAILFIITWILLVVDITVGIFK